MLTRHLTNKILDIRLEEEKFYFPGETIKGLVIVHPKNAIKVNSIQLKFCGQVFIHLKEKETNTLFEDNLTLSVYPNSTSPKQTTLNASEHCFSFEFIVPKNLNLPSSMEFGKKAHIRYTINALLDRPMIPESLCPKVEYAVSFLEYIDIEKDQFKIPQEKSQDIMLPKAKYNQKCMVRASMPRLGFTRGDIVPLKVNVDHFTSYARKNGVTVDLVRTVEIRTSRHTIFKEAVLRSTQYDLDIKPQSYQQSILCQLLIPTSTPPSIRYKDKVLRFHYKVRITVTFGDQSTCTLDMPIVIGTWPRAAVPIDDDDDSLDQDTKDSCQTNNGADGDDGDDDDIESLKTGSVDDQSSVRNSSNILPSWYTNNSSTTTLTTPHRSSVASNKEDLVNRSDSIASKVSNNSASSCTSSRSWEQQHQQQQHQYQQQHPYYHHHHYSHSSNNLSRNVSQSTTLSSPDRLPSYYNNGSPMNHNRPSSVYSTDYPYSNNNISRNSSHGSNGYPFYSSSRQSMVSLPPLAGPMAQQPYNGNRLSRYSRYEDDPSIILEHDDVPTHILEPLPSSVPSPIDESQQQEQEQLPTVVAAAAAASVAYLPESSDSSSFEDSDEDEDDLLAIIERKKKKEQKELRRKQKAEAAANPPAS
ncbi:hypothetical protein [Parasitella parasitica]|uniref:Arrestin C-terminal-like domain-containing protein n=1 Tax=Parasitella parasitica TaxID=35722 RepID=A0A0B7NGP9_9FUNG|nr:hypothetical protein [Parasitella parasitica]